MLRKLASGTLIVAVVLVGLLAHLSAYLFELAPFDTDPSQDVEAAYGQDGSHSVGVTGLVIDNGATLPVSVWYPSVEAVDGATTYSYGMNMFGPDGAIALATFDGVAVRGADADTSAGPFPLVVLSPGFAIRSSSYAWLAEHLASHGFVVASLEHDESLDPGTLWRSTIERPQDVLALIAYFDERSASEGPMGGLVNTDRVAVIGHSYGGYSAQAVGGARLHTKAFRDVCTEAYAEDDPIVFLCDALLQRLGDMAKLAGLEEVPPGLWPPLGGPSVDAVISMAGDAAMFGQHGLSELTVPVMAIGGTADTDSPYRWGTGFTAEHVASDRRIEIALDDALHMIFAGECETARRIMSLVPLGFCTDPSWNRHEAHQLIKHYATAFLLAELVNDEEATDMLASEDQTFSGVTYRAEGY